MKKEYHRDTKSVLVSFSADGPYIWQCCVAYTWCQSSHAYWVYTTQTAGFAKSNWEAEMASLRDVHRYLHYLQDLEECFKSIW